MSEIETLSLLFDSAWYLATYQDVAAANCDPLEHYLSFGYKEGRDPNRFFNTNFYLATYPDLAACHLNPFIHYILYGASEGRLPRSPHLSPLPPIVFDIFLQEDEEEIVAEVIDENPVQIKQVEQKTVKAAKNINSIITEKTPILPRKPKLATTKSKKTVNKPDIHTKTTTPAQKRKKITKS